MQVTCGKMARLYTYKEVKTEVDEAVKEVRQQMKEGFAKSVDDVVQVRLMDELLTLTYVYLNVLADMGLQKAGMEDLLARVAEYSDGMNNGSVGFSELRDRIVGILGYELEDPGREETLNKAIQKMKA